VRALTAVTMLGGVMPLHAIAAPEQYVTYHEAFLTVEIPATALRSRSGRFVVQHGSQRAEFDLAWSTPHVDERSVNCDGGSVTYEVSKPELFAYSCLLNGKVIYHAEKLGRTYRVGASDATETVELHMTYPADERIFWDPIVTHMSRTLRVQAPKR